MAIEPKLSGRFLPGCVCKDRSIKERGKSEEGEVGEEGDGGMAVEVSLIGAADRPAEGKASPKSWVRATALSGGPDDLRAIVPAPW